MSHNSFFRAVLPYEIQNCRKRARAEEKKKINFNFFGSSSLATIWISYSNAARKKELCDFNTIKWQFWVMSQDPWSIFYRLSPIGIAYRDRLSGSPVGIAYWDRLSGSPIVYRLPSTVYRLPSIACRDRPSSIVYRLPSTVHPLSGSPIVYRLSSTVYRLSGSPIVYCQSSTVYRLSGSPIGIAYRLSSTI